MCEQNVYMLNEEGEERLIMKSVDKFIPKENGIYLENIFGERKTIQATVKEMRLVDHRIILEAK
ncbi:CooT family nickel-binding protein [Bacillus massiliigorillae]|uniref:CooT family nickel-binding protein n=1 Tax=Bacillus massiliigorillae TaxID=1243664 RepID=UPI00039EEC57|nr:CooT family nickel-binding protein [Bacillus massiliigorillae]